MIDTGRYCAALVSKLRNGFPNVATIVESAGDARPKYANGELVRGHDLAAVLAVGVRSVLGNRSSSLDELVENIEIAIRGAFDLEMIQSSSIGGAVSDLAQQLGVRLIK